MSHLKPHLPQKICPVCQRPFSWRKKWERCWDAVVYCSARCRSSPKSPEASARLVSAGHEDTLKSRGSLKQGRSRG